MNRNPQYFEGVLQLRSPNQEIVDFISEEIKKKGNVWIAKTAKQKNGIDLYISSNKFLHELANRLKSRFCGELIRSNTLFSVNKHTSKEIHRGCFLFRHYDIKKGDIIDYRGDRIQIIAIGNDILAKDTVTNRKLHIKFSELKDLFP